MVHCNVDVYNIMFKEVLNHFWNMQLWYLKCFRKATDLIPYSTIQIVSNTRFIALFNVKNEVSAETIFIFIFYVPQFQVKTE